MTTQPDSSFISFLNVTIPIIVHTDVPFWCILPSQIWKKCFDVFRKIIRVFVSWGNIKNTKSLCFFQTSLFSFSKVENLIEYGLLDMRFTLAWQDQSYKSTEKYDLIDSRFRRIVLVWRVLKTNHFIKITLFGFESLVDRNRWSNQENEDQPNPGSEFGWETRTS